jgi:hypothetical protein
MGRCYRLWVPGWYPHLPVRRDKEGTHRARSPYDDGWDVALGIADFAGADHPG